MKQFKQMGGFDKMDKKGKEDFMKPFDNMRGMFDMQNFKDRMDDDDKKKGMEYYKHSDMWRGDMDKQLGQQKGMREMQRQGGN